ncbi:MAG: HAD family hydrolase [Thermofilum sp.]|nr:HAD family hydrolase [Thermofilum sp.]
MPLVSFDVWGTLLYIDPFYRAAAESLSWLKGISVEEAYGFIRRGYEEVKRARKLGLIDEESIVESSIGIALSGGSPGISRYDIYAAFALAVNKVKGEDLLIPGSLETVETLDKDGFTLALASNVIFWPGYVTRILVDKAGLSRFFKVQVYADEVRCLKPGPRIFRDVLTLTGSKPSEAYHVGDSPAEDLAGAIASGIGGILIDSNQRDAYINRPLRIAIVKNIADVPKAIRMLF